MESELPIPITFRTFDKKVMLYDPENEYLPFYWKGIGIFIIIILFIPFFLYHGLFLLLPFGFAIYFRSYVKPDLFLKLCKEYFLKDQPKPDQFIGSLAINDRGFSLKTDTLHRSVNFNEVTQIKLFTTNYAGYALFGFMLPLTGNAMITATLADNKRVEVKFQITREYDLKLLTTHIESWYKKGIIVKEYSALSGDLLVLQKADWSYEEYQELKKRLGVENFYKKGF